MAAIVPLNPLLQVHPVGTSFPVESNGQLTAAQLPEKNGVEDVAAIVPLKPALHVQSPAGTLVPVESAGQLVAAHWRLPLLAVYFPAAHCSQDSAVGSDEKKCRAHSVQLDDPGELWDLPAAQSLHAASDDPPGVLENLPARQLVQLALPVEP